MKTVITAAAVPPSPPPPATAITATTTTTTRMRRNVYKAGPLLHVKSEHRGDATPTGASGFLFAAVLMMMRSRTKRVSSPTLN